MGTTSSKSGEQRIEKQIIFKSKDGEVFRIPAIYYNENEKKLFAFAEKRISRDDSDAVALVMSVGKVKRESGVKWSTPKEIMKKCTCGYHPMNPCVVYEKHTETLFLFFNYVSETQWFQLKHHLNMARLCYITKKNDDKWSEFIDLTNQLPEMNDWSTFAVGPGHGIQTDSGRMIVPAYAYIGPEDEKPISHAFYFYSDDYGNTWKCEEMLSEISGECEMTEVFDSSNGESLIYCNARSLGSYRVQAKIDKSGVSTLRTTTPLVEVHKGCQGSVISFPAQTGDAKPSEEKWLLFSHPTNQRSDLERLDLGVYLNTSPVTSVGELNLVWSQPWVINKGPSGYSDLTYIEDGWFACLMECGEKSATDEIACQVFSYEEVLRGIPNFRT
ncbi:sialidase-3-like isoform X1 [Poecilia formosa]|uniref:sialidase-3-like isoform X1 n=1 Tax=Poecilia formosa TaxID=48698 RepID=UPI000443D300|nr:PREDICTED: sialidase-3-like isoform X1 [Poecilia formosa]